MSVRSLTKRLSEERSEAGRRSQGRLPVEQAAENGTEVSLPPSAVFKGGRPEPPEAPPVVVQEPSGLKPRRETPRSAIPGGIADRFRLRSQRESEISRSIDAYTSQITTATPESDSGKDDPDSETAPITIELQSH